MMPNIQKHDYHITFVIADNLDIHVDTELEKVISSLKPFFPQRRMEWVFLQESIFTFHLLFLSFIKLLEILYECRGT